MLLNVVCSSLARCPKSDAALLWKAISPIFPIVEFA